MKLFLDKFEAMLFKLHRFEHIKFFYLGKKFILNVLSKERFYIVSIFFLSLLSIILTLFYTRFSDNTVENQFRWLNSYVLQNKYISDIFVVKIQKPFVESGWLKAGNQNDLLEAPRSAYDSYLKLINDPILATTTIGDYEKEILSITSYKDLNQKIDREKVQRVVDERLVFSENIRNNSIWSSRLFRIIVAIQVITALLAFYLEVKRKKDKKLKAPEVNS